MTARLPVVFDDIGNLGELQAGDSLIVPPSVGNRVSLTNGNGSSLPACAPVYLSASSTVDLAKADAALTRDVVGLVPAAIAPGQAGLVQLDGILSAATSAWDVVAGTTGGLTPKSWYYLSPATGGKLTATPPTTPGQWLAPIGFALSSTDLLLRITRPTLR